MPKPMLTESDHLRLSAARFRRLGFPVSALLMFAEAWRQDHPGECILDLAAEYPLEGDPELGRGKVPD
jgi:hypothetical protein